MGKKAIVVLLVSLALALVHLAKTQQPKKVPRMGYLSPFEPARESASAEAIRLALRERGYLEGQNIATEYRYAEGKVDRAPELAAELVRLKVDIILVGGGYPWIRAAKNATTTIPIVFIGVGDPVGTGVVASLAHPGGNVTGLSNLTPELAGKQVELLKEAFPNISHVAVLWETANAGNAVSLREMRSQPRHCG